jgi:hypothetical protein
MKKNKTTWLSLIIAGLLLILFLRECGDNGNRGGTGLISSDTTSVTVYTTHVDTIPFYNIKDSIRWHDLPMISSSANEDSSEFNYVTEMSDSLIDGKIATTVKADGTLVEQGFTYIPKFPKYITRTDSVVTTNTITNTIMEPDWGIYAGMDIAPWKEFALVPNIGLKTKNDMFFGIGYDPFSQSVYAQFKMKIIGK